MGRVTDNELSMSSCFCLLLQGLWWSKMGPPPKQPNNVCPTPFVAVLAPSAGEGQGRGLGKLELPHSWSVLVLGAEGELACLKYAAPLGHV